MEDQRTVLADHYSFESRTAFNRIDRQRNYKISTIEI